MPGKNWQLISDYLKESKKKRKQHFGTRVFELFTKKFVEGFLSK